MGQKIKDFGYVFKQNRKWFVFHCDDQSLILQHKKEIWRVNSKYSVHLHGDETKRFDIFHDNRIVFSIEYIANWFLPQIFNTTYDAFDLEMDDFFLYVTNMWSDWSQRPFFEFKQKYLE